jgi:hypothetical protein
VGTHPGNASMASSGLESLQRGLDDLQASLALRAPMDNTKILFRFLVVKQWVDRLSSILH